MLTDADADVAIAAAQAGATVALAAFGTDLDHHAKEGVDFATDADVAAERAIRASLAAARPDDGVVGEELGSTGGTTRRWLVDPICGTLNFAAGLPLFAVNVALEVDGVPAVAAVADPPAGTVTWCDGGGAFVRTAAGDAPVRPSASSRLVVVNLESHYPGRSGLHLLDDVAFRASFFPRVVSSTLGLAWVAAGRAAAYVSGGRLHGSVHFTAGIALCQAAGAVVTALDGGPLGPEADGLIAAADAGTHAALLDRLRELAVER
ncbi:inositol monophosphatase family protein [Xylanimonas sp. McL0601]|uniref:inositol monophosphatase family protein n=1 Tax=Xylanimonas sp. McL0601 TaxID=3414739 RepID=UPI003CE6919D